MRNCRYLQLTFILLLLAAGTIPFVITRGDLHPQIVVSHTAAQSQTDLTGVRIGIYEGYFRSDESRTALINMFEWMNATVNVFNTTEILNGALWSCEVLVIPEGLGPTLESLLTDDGLDAIRQWVALGGSYIGVRGSAAMAVRYSYFEGDNTEFGLALINGTSFEVTELDSLVMTNVSINRECIGPDLSEMPANLSVLFQTGRYILPGESQELIFIANYTHEDLPAMVASYYGQGTVFISSPHFEYEENDDRDGTDYRDTFDDPDSEWPFMLTITRWLIESSPKVCNMTEWPYTPTDTTPTPSTTDSPIIPAEILIIGGGLGVVVIAVLVVYVRRT